MDEAGGLKWIAEAPRNLINQHTVIAAMAERGPDKLEESGRIMAQSLDPGWSGGEAAPAYRDIARHARKWTATDPSGARQWVNSLPKGYARKAGEAGLASTPEQITWETLRPPK
jgi:hypothetical protein